MTTMSRLQESTVLNKGHWNPVKVEPGARDGPDG